jgi:hypothetical protein
MALQLPLLQGALNNVTCRASVPPPPSSDTGSYPNNQPIQCGHRCIPGRFSCGGLSHCLSLSSRLGSISTYPYTYTLFLYKMAVGGPTILWALLAPLPPLFYVFLRKPFLILLLFVSRPLLAPFLAVSSFSPLFLLLQQQR